MEKSKQISESLKSMPPGSPFIFSGQSSNLDKASKELQQLEMPDEVTVNASKSGVEVTFSKTVAFDQGSIELKDKAIKAFDKMMASPTGGRLGWQTIRLALYKGR